jgi:magnesium-protoporphyrin O-methyltransferase
MAGEAAARAKALGIKNAKFYTSDLESVTGNYDTVTCVDVAIHYPTEKMAEMVGHLCSLSNDRVLVSFAPKTWYYSLLKKVGELFPGPSKTTRAYLHEEQVVRDALQKAGFEVTREEMTATNFYFSRLLEARKA